MTMDIPGKAKKTTIDARKGSSSKGLRRPEDNVAALTIAFLSYLSKAACQEMPLAKLVRGRSKGMDDSSKP